MRIIVAVTAVLTLSSCTTITGTQADCFRQNSKFENAANCMRSEMNSLKWGSATPLSALNDYEVYLSSMEAKVKRGEVSDENAKIRMQEYLIRLRNSY